MESLIKKYDALPVFLRIFIGGLITAVPFYFAAYLSFWIGEIAKVGKPIWVHAITFTVLFAFLVAITRYIIFIRDRLHHEEEELQAVVLHAYTYLDRLLSHRLSSLKIENINKEKFIEAFSTSIEYIQNTVEAAYNTFEAAFGKSSRFQNRIDFEVTFMTKSYIDGKITIPACANREGRAPRSMILRKDNPDVYNNTITAKIYEESKPSMKIIENTSTNNDYKELYNNQKERIKSSIIYPVLSDKNELLGTLVVHCDQANFFSRGSYKYWNDLFEIFAKDIALAKARMDLLINYGKQIRKKEIEIKLPNNYF